jgi:hypothetical protein
MEEEPEPMRALIVYESLYGTNRTIAEAIAAGLGADATVTLLDAETAPATIDDQVDLLVVGGPNHQFGLPRPATRAEAAAEWEGERRPAERGLREWLEDLRLSRPGQPAAVWDTRMAAPRVLDFLDRSGGTIAKRLRRAGARLVGTPQKYYSADGVGALVEGEEERARAWGAELAGLMRRP